MAKVHAESCVVWSIYFYCLLMIIGSKINEMLLGMTSYRMLLEVSTSPKQSKIKEDPIYISLDLDWLKFVLISN